MTVTVTSLIFALVGILFVGFSIPLMRNQIPPNRYYGFRTPKTLSNPEIWYEVNRISGKDMFLAGALIIISSLMMFVFAQQQRSEQVAITLLLIMVFSFAGVALHGFMVLKRM